MRRRGPAADAQRIDLLMQAINEGVYDWDIVSGTVYYSDWVRRAVGLSAAELKTVEDWRNRIHPDDLGRFDGAMVEHLKGRTERFECDFRYRARDGSWRWARQHGFSLRDAQGRATRMIGSTGDITELKQTAEALRASEERYALAMHAATEGVYEWDLASGKLYISDTTKVFFWSKTQTLTPESWNARVHPEDFPIYRQAIADHFKQRTPQLECEYRIRDASGEYLWVLDRGVGVRDADGRVIKFVGAVSDITARKRAEQALVHAHAETTAALERQKATADVLTSMSNSMTDAQPVFDSIVRNIRRLFGTRTAVLQLLRDGMIEMPSLDGPPGFERLRERYPMPLDETTIGGRAMASKQVVQFAPVIGNPEAPATAQDFARTFGFNSVLFAPMIHEERVVGAIGAAHPEARPFDERQVALIRTFAEQAVIAIENVRLFRELESSNRGLAKSLEQQTAMSELLRAVAASPTDARPVLQALAERAAQLCGALYVNVLLEDGGLLHTMAVHSAVGGPQPEPDFRMQATRGTVNGRAFLERRVVHVPDFAAVAECEFPDAVDIQRRFGFRTILGVPLLREDRAIGTISIWRREVRPFSDDEIALLRTFAAQAVIAIENVRLFHEVRAKSAQLEIANRHKSEFLANMSHELRTPLNAIIGFSEVLGERYFGELTAKQDEYVKDIHASGRHLLSLINDILDLSKIEAGRMELETTEFDIRSAIDNAITLVKERAQRHGIALRLEVASGVGTIRADERKFKQIMLNLLSNAVKFTPEGGSVSIVARPMDTMLEVSVTDTGIGIAPEDQAAVFEEFKQVGPMHAAKAEGTGLGMPLAKRFVELHGGSIRLESSPGHGATFTFSLPLPQS